MRKCLTVVLILFSSVTVAKTISTSSTARPVPVVVDGSVGRRVCYYQDEAYSEGALLQIGELYMTCEAANKYETNGQLKWVQLDTEQKKASAKD